MMMKQDFCLVLLESCRFSQDLWPPWIWDGSGGLPRIWWAT